MSEGSAGPPAVRYCPYYCEENIWHLCADERVAGCELRVLFVSSHARRVAMWGQRASADPELPIVWDYHVVLLARRGGASWELWDLDGVAPPPRPARAWLDDSFRGAGVVPPQYEPHFRLVRAEDYRRHLRSDRGHMRGPGGVYQQPPPSWPLIWGEPLGGASDGDSNLHRFLDTRDPSFLGELCDLPGLRRWLA